MEIYKDIKMKCAEVDISITHLCEEAGVNIHTVNGWGRNGTPKSVETYLKIQEKLEEIKKEKFTGDIPK